MKSEDVAHYLQDHPEFFEHHSEMLALVTLPDPHSGRAISITEKQLIKLRDKVRALEAKLVELIRFGEENDAISDKVHGLAVALNSANDFREVLRVLYSHLGGAFAVPHVTLRLWGAGAGEGQEFEAVADSVMTLATNLQQPYCGMANEQETLAWFGEAATHLRSMTQVPLRAGNGVCCGLLVMASDDPRRFYPELGTLYLERIGDLASAALLRVTG
ncbi:MAG: DUF484 family protein [Sulfuritalea sp.]|nr:DUF484 family protein [Sulfuritalea sp.]